MEEEKTETCQFRKCGKLSDIIYLDRGLCNKHWIKICEMPMEKAHKLLKIKPKKKDTDAG